MSAIDLDNKTPIRIESLKKLYQAALRTEKSLGSPRNLNSRFFLVAGIPILQHEQRQSYQNLEEMTAAQHESAQQLLSIVKFICKKRSGVSAKPLPEWVEAEKERRAKAQSKTAKSKAKKRKLSSQDELQKYGISIKTPESIKAKATRKYMEENGPDYMRITDPVRVTLEVHNLSAIIALANYFRPCNNPDTVHFENSFACKDDEKGIRRLMINYRLPNGCIVEIQVHHKQAEAAYLKSHDAYKRERALSVASTKAFHVQSHKRIGVLHEHAHCERITLNEKVNEDLGLNGIVLNREFWSVDGYPVMKVYNPHTTHNFTVVPNPVSGFYEVDKRFDLALSDPARHDVKVEKITREDFLRRSMSLANSAEAREIISADRDLG